MPELPIDVRLAETVSFNASVHGQDRALSH